MSCKEIAGISIAGNHEETKKLRITYNEIFSCLLYTSDAADEL